MILGYRAGDGLLHQAHPFTPLTLACVTVVLAFALPPAAGPVALVAALVLVTVASRVVGVMGTALTVAVPFWVFLTLIHGVFGDDPSRAVALSARITALVLGFLIALVSVHPARLVDALLERGWPFQLAYLLCATLQAVPRLRERAGAILEAQRCRGLRVRGSPWRRMRAVVPLTIPLVLGALSEVDSRAIALEARGAHGATRRTPLSPPRDSWRQRALRWTLVVISAVAVLWRIAQ